MTYNVDYKKNNYPADYTLLSCELRALAHVLRYVDYIHGVTDDADFPMAMISLASDYLYRVSESCEAASDLTPSGGRNDEN